MPERQLWREPPCRCCVRRDDWVLTAARHGDAAVEVSLRRVDSGGGGGGASALWASAAAAAAAAASAAAAAAAAPAAEARPVLTALVLACLLSPLLVLLLLSRRSCCGGAAAAAAAAATSEEQRVLAVRGLGLALTDLRGGAVARRAFVDAGALKSIVVNEGVQRCDVAFYLACVVAGRGELLLLFDRARPRLPVIARILRELDAVMFPSRGLDGAIGES